MIEAASHRIGGAQGRKMRAALGTPVVKGLKAFGEPMTDADYALEIERVVNPEPPQSWDFPN